MFIKNLFLACVVFSSTSLYCQTPVLVRFDPKVGFSTGNSRICVDTAGSIREGFFVGQSNDHHLDTVYLCINDSLQILHNQDFNLSGDPEPDTQPGIAYGFFKCPPTVSGPSLDEVLNDPCIQSDPSPVNGLWLATGEPNGNVIFRNRGVLQNFFNQGKPVALWFAPITIDDFHNLSYASGDCVNVSITERFVVIYLNELTIEGFMIYTSETCKGRFQIKGGLPEFNTSEVYSLEIQKVGQPNIIGKVTTHGGLTHGTIAEFVVPEAGKYNFIFEDKKVVPRVLQSPFIPCTTSSTFGQAAENENFMLFPNPVGDFLNVRFADSSRNNSKTYSIFDVSGKRCHSGKISDDSTPIDLRELEKGFYQIKFLGGNEERGYFVKM